MRALPHGYRLVAPEVVYADGELSSVVHAGPDIVDILRERAMASPRKRCRLCTHPNPDAAQQEMLIVMSADSYVRPHRHFGKSETFTVLEGEVDALVFAEDGALSEVIAMGPYESGRQFFYRMPERVFHTMVFRTPWLVYLETTIGPFSPDSSEGAPWSPPESDPDAGQAWLAALDRRELLTRD